VLGFRATLLLHFFKMVTRDLVVSAYRLILGRDPETESVIEQAASAYGSEQELRAALLGSPEFASQIGHFIPRYPHDLGLELPIEVECNAADLQQLLTHTGRTWEKLGANEPYWSVLTSESFKSDQFHNNEEEFWGSGKHDVHRLITWMRRNGIAPSADWSCLEYGCGTGRMTYWLAEEFKAIFACDISGSHLRLARQRLSGVTSASVEFIEIFSLSALDQLPVVDMVFSIIVLQHNPPPIIAYILDKLLKTLRPGGIAQFQIPTFWRGYTFELAQYLKHDSGEEMETHVLPQRYVFEIARRNGCFPLEVQPDGCVGSPEAISTTFLLRKAG